MCGSNLIDKVMAVCKSLLLCAGILGFGGHKGVLGCGQK